MMNNRQTRALCVLGASALLMGTAAVIDLQAGGASPAPVSAEIPTQTATQAPLPAYLVRAQDGMVAVFSGDGTQLLRMTDASVAALPAPDRAELASGIPVNDELSLAMLLEDYSE